VLDSPQAEGRISYSSVALRDSALDVPASRGPWTPHTLINAASFNRSVVSGNRSFLLIPSPFLLRRNRVASGSSPSLFRAPLPFMLGGPAGWELGPLPAFPRRLVCGTHWRASIDPPDVARDISRHKLGPNKSELPLQPSLRVASNQSAFENVTKKEKKIPAPKKPTTSPANFLQHVKVFLWGPCEESAPPSAMSPAIGRGVPGFS